MAIWDKLLTFFDAQAITATTNSAGLDLGPDVGSGVPLYLHAQVVEDFAGGTSLTLTLQESADNTTFTEVEKTAVIPLASLKAGYQFKLGSVPRNTQRYLRLNVTAAGTFTGGKLTAYVNFDN
jgi:hypothetical protein